MNTENLQEMIAGANTEPATRKMSEYDILLGHTKKNKELPATEQKDSSPGQELQVAEKSEPVGEPPDNYQPDGEVAMIAYINGLNAKLGKATIVTHWQIGQTVNSFYKGKQGTNELGKIAVATGIGRDTLAKACKFVKQYSKENVEMLLKGYFVMSWYQIAQHLTVEAQKVIETYQQSPDSKRFYNDIIKLKNPSEARGKSKPSKVVKEKPPAETPIIVTTEIIIPQKVASKEEPAGLFSQKFMVFEEPVNISENNLEELDKLKIENDHLRKEILIRIEKIGKLEKALSDVKLEKEKYENGYYAYMHRMDKIKEGLENQVPAGALIDWIENGDDD